MTTMQSIFTIMVVVLGTLLTRFIPFIIFPEGKTLLLILHTWGPCYPMQSLVC